MNLCSSCRAPIVWALSSTNRRMCFDATPGERIRGYVITNGEARYVKQGAPGVPIYTSHFATCPHSATHRHQKKTNFQ